MNKMLPYFWTLYSASVILNFWLPVAHLFLKGARDQPAQLAQAVVDPVTAPFLDDLCRDTTCVIWLFFLFVFFFKKVMHKVSNCTEKMIFKNNYLLLDASSSPAPEWTWWATWTREESSCSFKKNETRRFVNIFVPLGFPLFLINFIKGVITYPFSSALSFSTSIVSSSSLSEELKS